MPVCPERNPDQLSLSELEYRRAVERELPRLMFIMGAAHPLTLADHNLSLEEGPDSHDKHKAFIEMAMAERVTAEFISPDDLKAKATTSFRALCELLDTTNDAANPVPKSPPSPDEILLTAPPAFHYVRTPYIEKQGFAGRTRELTLIDDWATGNDAMLLFQAIGGMGKSMLTWHWLKNRAAAVRSDWAGQFWYSFYEQGADLNDFCIHALAYIRHEPPSKFRGRGTVVLADELLRELNERPFLMVLDGLERVLVAYNRAGKDHMTDEEAAVANDAMGLDRAPRGCFRPEDDDVLAILVQAERGKLLASSRLVPSALINAANQPIPGVRHVALEGLEPEDAERLLRNADVRGDSLRMQNFLKEKLACHPLSVGVVAGKVMNFLEARGDFDNWLEHPEGGADPALISKDLRGRQNHILSRAFEDLDDDEQALLGSIAMASIELTPEILCILNPKRPIEPKNVNPPEEWTERELYLRTSDTNIDAVYDAWSVAKNPDERAAAQVKLDALREKNFAERKEKYHAFLAEHAAWQALASAADKFLAQTLPDLEARGLLQYDAESGALDMHPAIRHTALIGLSTEARGSTGTHVSDALASRPVKPFDDARSLADLSLAMTRVEALNAAGKIKEGWDLLVIGGLSGALRRLLYGHQNLELMHVYFPQGWENGPLALPESRHSGAYHQAASALIRTGKPDLASILFVKGINKELSDDEETSATDLGNLVVSLKEDGQRACAELIRSLAIRLAEAKDDEHDLRWLKTNQAINHLERGNLNEAESILVPLRDAIATGNLQGETEAAILKTDLYAASYTGRLSETMAETSLNRIRALGQRFEELWALSFIARWRQAGKHHEAALAAFGDLIALGRETGWQDLPDHEVLRALSLLAMGGQEEALKVAEKVDQGKKPPHVPLALLYLELGDKAKAHSHALAGYKKAWGEGPPYHNHWWLEDCRKVLAAIGEPEPQLPPFDPAKVEAFDFEPAIERQIEKILAEKAEREEKKARRTAREAEMVMNAEATAEISQSADTTTESEPEPKPSSAPLLASSTEPTRDRHPGLLWLALLGVLVVIAAGLTIFGV